MLEKFTTKLNIKKDIYLRIKVHPGASKTAVKDVLEDDTIKIDIAAVPERGRANKELIKYLAKEFTVAKENVKIISGAGERLKLLRVVR